MPTKSPRDPNQLARQVLLGSVGGFPKTELPTAKDPAAISLARRGGIAREAALPAKKRADCGQGR